MSIGRPPRTKPDSQNKKTRSIEFYPKWYIFCLRVNISCEIQMLARIDNCNKVIQARDVTLDVEAANIETLFEDLI